MTLSGKIREFYLLNGAKTISGRITPEQKERARLHIDLGRQRSAAALLLHTHGDIAEGLKLARTAFSALLEATQHAVSSAPRQSPAPPPPIFGESCEQLLVECGRSPVEIEAIKALVKSTAESDTQRLRERDVEQEHRVLYDRLQASSHVLSTVLNTITMADSALNRKRTGRIVFSSLALVLALALFIWFLTYVAVGPKASAEYSQRHSSAHVIDGKENTEWLLPDRRLGWIDVVVDDQDIKTLHLLNATNRIHDDRATRKYAIEIFTVDNDDKPTKKIVGSWPKLLPKPVWTDHAVEIDNVERIRIRILSWHGKGGGLAEVKWD